MKYCNKCNKFFDTDEVKCPVCGKGMQDVQNDDISTDEVVSSMTITGIL